MTKRISDDLDMALRNIANNGDEAMPKETIKRLMELSYITAKFGGGWMVNSKARNYLKQYPM